MSDDVFWWCVFIGSVSTALIVSAMCSIAESVLLSLSMAQITEIGKVNPKIGKIWEDFKKDVDVPITLILAINTTAHTVGASCAGAAFAKIYGETWIWLFSLIFTFLMLQYTEILPKTLGVRFNKTLAFWIARPLLWTTKVGDPLINLLQYLNKPFEVRTDGSDSIDTVEEISLLTLLAKDQSLLNTEQEVIIHKALKLSETEVSKVMVPIDEVIMLSDNLTPANAFKIAQNDTYTRFPVYYGNNEELIIGYVNFKELAVSEFDASNSSWNANEGASGDLSRFVRAIIKVEESDRASDVLNTLVKNHEHIALVLDSDQKTTIGLLTMEDLIEELLGEIEDEFDCLPETLYDYSGMVRAGGGVSLDRVGELVEKVFPGKSDEFIQEVSESSSLRLTEWIESKFPDSFARNSRVDCGKLSFWVKRMRRGHASEVVILVKD
jgi:putative hemolysin